MLVALAACRTGLPGPGDQEPAAPLAVRPTEDALAWVQTAAATSQKLVDQLAALADREVSSADAIDLNAAWATACQLQRLGKRLIDLREPAGVDFELRAERAFEQIRKRVQQVRQHADFSRVQNELARGFQGECRKRQKSLPNVKRLVQTGKLAEADEAYNKLADDLQSGQLWFDASFYAPLLKPFADTKALYAEKFRQEYKANDAAWLAKALEDATPRPDPATLLGELRRAVDQMGTAPTVTFEGQPLTGPQWIRAAAEAVQRMQAVVTRHDVYHWYAKGVRDKRTVQGFQTLREELPGLLARGIEASVRQVEPAQIPELYLACLEALTPLASRAWDDAFVNSLERSLQPLLETSPELRERVMAYDQATSGMLAWRARTAQACARDRRKDLKPLEEVFQEAVRPNPPLRGLMGASQQPMCLMDPLDELTRVASQLAIGKGVILKKVDGSRGVARPVASRYASGCYATMLLTSPPSAVIESLKGDLLVVGDRKPLTLEAASAIWALEHGCVEELGGQTASLHFEAMTMACLSLTPDDAQFVHLGPLATDELIEPERQLCAWLEVQPAWYLYKYQFVGR